MKLSEIQSTDRFLDVVCDISPYIQQLIEDEEISKLWKDKLKVKKGEVDMDKIMTMAFDKGIEKLFKFIPILLRKNRGAIYGILSVLDEKEIEEIASQHPMTTIISIQEAILDPEFRKLFLSFKEQMSTI